MKFEKLEVAKERAAVYEMMCADNDRRRTEAREEVAAAKAEAQELMNRQIDGEDVIDELAKAQARVTVAETKYQRLVQEIGVSNPEMDMGEISFLSVQSQLNAYMHGGLQEDMEAELEELEEAKNQYLAAAEKALVKFYELRQEYRQSVQEAEQLFDRVPTGRVPEFFTESLLRPYGLWWEKYDAANDMSPVKKRAVESVEGSLPEVAGFHTENEMLLPRPEGVTGPGVRQDETGRVWQRQAESY